MAKQFSDKTFQYFDQARKNKNSEKWFEKNKDLYLENVREPFQNFQSLIHRELGADLPRIDTLKSLSRPLRPKNRVTKEASLLKRTAYVTLWEKNTSRFEWNPGLHFQLGPEKDDNFIGVGLYHPSSRQLSLLRNALVENFEEIDEILNDRKLKKAWGGIQGDTYKRFPKGYDPENPRSIYLWHKSFYLGRELTRSEVKSKDFAAKLVKDLKTTMRFFKWVRAQVGVYRPSSGATRFASTALLLILLSVLPLNPASALTPLATTPSVNAEKSLGWLKNGNIRFRKHLLRNDGAAWADIKRLSTEQSPHAIVVSCSDSRVPPEIVFDQKLGEIFTVRTAGQALDNNSVGSIEYAVEHLGSKLILVMGHSNCGAVKVALDTLDGKDAGSPALNALVKDIHPRIQSFKGKSRSQNLEEESWANVDGVTRDLIARSKILRDHLEKGDIKIQTALYHLDSGNVTFGHK